MKKISIGIAITLLMASAAMAGEIQVGYPGSNFGPYQTGAGGEFTYHPLNNWLDLSGYVDGTTKNIGVPGTFQSFCIEGNEYVYPGNPIYNAVINTNAMNGGVTGGGDPISVGTGWLYAQFATNVWESGLSYNYADPGRSGIGNSADLLQKAIWWLEGEENLKYDASNPYMEAVVSWFGSEQAAMDDDKGSTFGVFALNMTSQTGALRQDTLYYKAPVPDGGLTALLLGLGIGGLALFSRMFK